MKDQIEHLFTALVLLLIGAVTLDSSQALAAELPVRGGKGGEYFHDACPAGSYLVGLEGRNGAWVDQIAPICAPWRWDLRAFGPPLTGALHGTSGGGVFNKRICSPDKAITQWFLFPTVGNGSREPKFVETIHGKCDRIEPPFLSKKKLESLSFGCSAPFTCMRGLPRETWMEACPQGELAVGIHGRAGLFLDAIGLICAPRPIPLAPPATNANPLVKAPPPTDDMFIITRPTPGDRVPQDRLIVTATPPKVGMTPVTELEFRWLDAPPNQRDSYPYVTVLAVDTPKLLQCYPVAPIVMGGYTGRWQVRARAGMKAVPGPWSYPVEFRLLLTQPGQSQDPCSPIPQTSPLPSSSIAQPSPVPQTAPLPSSSVVQPPAQGGSTPAPMVRPPTAPSTGSGGFSGMIRRRGLDEASPGQPSPEPEKAR